MFRPSKSLTRKQVHEARLLRDAEKAKPGVIKKAIDDKLNAGQAPSAGETRSEGNAHTAAGATETRSCQRTIEGT
jgi:hypothetical protein